MVVVTDSRAMFRGVPNSPGRRPTWHFPASSHVPLEGGRQSGAGMRPRREDEAIAVLLS